MSVVTFIEDSLYDSITAIFSDIGYPHTKVVFANENGLEPKNTYCIINLLNRERQGRTYESTYLTEESEMWRTEHFKLSIQLSFLGTNANNLAWDFDDVFPSSRTFIEEFQKRNLGFLYKSQLRRAPQPRETKWVEGWNLDIDFSFAIQSRQVMDWIEYITINGEVIRIYPDMNLRTVEGDIPRTVESGSVRDFFIL